LRAIWSGKAKTDKLDAKVLAELLRADLMPQAYVPPKSYQLLLIAMSIGAATYTYLIGINLFVVVFLSLSI
jgi:hypothetical protein